MIIIMIDGWGRGARRRAVTVASSHRYIRAQAVSAAGPPPSPMAGQGRPTPSLTGTGTGSLRLLKP